MEMNPVLANLKNLSLNTPKPRTAFNGKMGESAFHGPMGEFIKFINSRTEADPVAILTQSLVVFGNMLGSGPRHYMGNSDLRTNEFLAIVGSSAKARKGTSLSVVRSFLDPLDPEHHRKCRLNTLASGEGLVHALRDPMTTDKGPDPGVTDKRLLVEAEEFGSILTGKGRSGSTLTATLRTAWDSRDLSNPTKNNSEFVTGPHVSVIGHITAHELKSLMMDGDTHNGFANRFLWVYVSKSKSIPFPARVSADEWERFREPLRHALLIGKRDHHLELAEDARDLYEQEHARLGEESGDDVFDAHTARGLSHLMKIAQIYALADGSSVIGVDHFMAGKAVWEFSEKSVEYIFQVDGLSKLARKLDSAMKKNPGSTKSDHHRFLGGHKRAEEIERAREELISRGLYEIRPVDPSAESSPLGYWPADTELMNLMNSDD